MFKLSLFFLCLLLVYLIWIKDWLKIIFRPVQSYQYIAFRVNGSKREYYCMYRLNLFTNRIERLSTKETYVPVSADLDKEIKKHLKSYPGDKYLYYED